MSKTNITERELYERRNTDNVFIRNVIGGLLKVLNNKLIIDQVWDDSKDGIEYITIPFYYDLGNPSSERFLQDNYLQFGNQCGFKKINGNFDMIPRGMISLTGASIQSDAITNRMIQGEYQREDPSTGEINTYIAMLYAIPISVKVSVEIRSASFVEMLKIDQACKSVFYKNKTYYITYKGMKLGCRVGFPDNFLAERSSGYTMGNDADKNEYKQSFELEIECYQPEFDYTTEQLATNKIRAFASEVSLIDQNNMQDLLHVDNDIISNEPYYYSASPEFKDISEDHDDFNLIYVIDKFGNHEIWSSDSIMKIRWGYRKNIGDMHSIKLSYYDHETNKSTTIDVLQNKRFYDWKIPKNFSKFKQIDFNLENSQYVYIHKNPIIKVIPDPETKKITEDSFYCLDPGYFIYNPNYEFSENMDTKDIGCCISAHIGYEDKNGKYIDGIIQLPILNSEIATKKDDPNKIDFSLLGDNREKFSINYYNNIDYKEIDFIISDANNPKISCKIPNIKII